MPYYAAATFRFTLSLIFADIAAWRYALALSRWFVLRRTLFCFHVDVGLRRRAFLCHMICLRMPRAYFAYEAMPCRRYCAAAIYALSAACAHRPRAFTLIIYALCHAWGALITRARQRRAFMIPLCRYLMRRAIFVSRFIDGAFFASTLLMHTECACEVTRAPQKRRRDIPAARLRFDMLFARLFDGDKVPYFYAARGACAAERKEKDAAIKMAFICHLLIMPCKTRRHVLPAL